MNKVTTINLVKGAYLIKQNMIIKGEESEVTAIQFEDGSGTKFNYQIDGNPEWKFIDLTKQF